MNFFEQVPDRRGTRSAKWDLVKSLYGSDDVLPMWVADMDFPAPPPVTDALVERAKHGVFGYTLTDPSINKLITNWLRKRHDWQVNQSRIIYSPGVISTLHIAMQTITEPEDSILIQTPVYPPFYDVVKKHNRRLIKNPLKFTNNRYEIDFDDFEAKLKMGVKAFILCNPHNPVGRVWTKQELQRMGELCVKYDVFIFSDEIHADLIFPGHKHIPIASLSDELSNRTLTCMSPTKTFNLAGLQASYAVVEDKQLREQVVENFKKQGMGMLNTMAVTAMEAAYKEGETWLDELIEVLEKNKKLVVDTIQGRSDISIINPEGTYLLWFDCRKLGMSHPDLKKFMQEQAKLGLNDGISFGEEGEGFMRMNIACPTTTVHEGINRLVNALEKR